MPVPEAQLTSLTSNLRISMYNLINSDSNGLNLFKISFLIVPRYKASMFAQ